MSLWLSGANAWTGAARGRYAAEAKKAQTAMTGEATRRMMTFWFPGTPAAPPSPKRKRCAKR